MTGLTDLIHAVQALAPDADLYDGDPSTDWLSMADYASVLFVLNQGVGATGTVTITANMAEDAAGTGSTAIPFTHRRVSDTTTSDVPGDRTAATATGFATTAGSNQVYLIEISDEELDEDSPFVNLTLTELVDSPVDAGVVAIMGEPRFAGATPRTAIA